MSGIVDKSMNDPMKCWMCEKPSDHLKKIDGTRCMKLYICSEKCRALFIDRLINGGGNIDPQRLQQPVAPPAKAKRLTGAPPK